MQVYFYRAELNRYALIRIHPKISLNLGSVPEPKTVSALESSVLSVEVWCNVHGRGIHVAGLIVSHIIKKFENLHLEKNIMKLIFALHQCSLLLFCLSFTV